MIGIVIVTHHQLGNALIDAAEMIIGNHPESVTTVSTDSEEPDILRDRIAGGIKKVDGKNGVLIFTDMFGGTPSNISYSFLKEGFVDVISAVNLPILLKAVNSRSKMNFSDLAKCLKSYGRKSITLASEILKGNKQNPASLCPMSSAECG